MNRLVVRLVLTHLLVAVVAGGVTFLVVRLLAPALYDQTLRMGMGQAGVGMGPGMGAGQQGLLRQQFADAVDAALVWGALAGAATAALVGVVAAYRVIRPLEAVRTATRALAQGRYAVPLPAPRTTELAELTADVQRLGQELAETESRRVRLLGEVAHEMRTPLTVIEGTAEGMIDGVLPASPESLAAIGGEVRRLRRLADDLSALSRADEGRLRLQCRDVDLGEVAATAAGRLRPQAQDAGLELLVEAAPALPVHADPDRIAQVVTNLVGNAIRATPPGGRITVACSARADTAVVQVGDTGRGLAAADLERVFERFYRVPLERDPEAGHDTGSGIGLTISRGIARAHGGEVTAASPGLGHGTTVTLTLPLAGSPAYPPGY